MPVNHSPKHPRSIGLKIFLISFFFIFCLLLVYFILFSIKTKKISAALPAESALIFTIEKPMDFWDDLQHSKIWRAFNRVELTDGLQSRIAQLHSQLGTRWRRRIIRLIFNEPAGLQIQIQANRSPNFLLVLDLGIKNKIVALLQRVLFRWLPPGIQLNHSKLTIRQQTIYQIQLAEPGKNFFYTFRHNLFLITNQLTLLENSIQVWQGQIKSLEQAENYQSVSRNIPSELSARIFLNTSTTLQLLEKIQPGEVGTVIEQLKKMISFTGLGFQFEPNRFIAQAFSLIDSTKASPQFQHLLDQSPHATHIEAFIPTDATAFSVATFDAFEPVWQFYKAQLRSDQKRWQQFQNSQHLAQQFTGINLEENVLNWVGQEMGSLKLKSGGRQDSQQQVFLLGTKDSTRALQTMKRLKSAFSQKTPIRFKEKSYQGIQISQIELPLFFKEYFGGMSDELTRPYWGILGPYLIFSENLKALTAVIRAYQSKQHLKTQPAYLSIRAILPEANNLLFYMTPAELTTVAGLLIEGNRDQKISQGLKHIAGLGIALSNFSGGLQGTICVVGSAEE